MSYTALIADAIQTAFSSLGDLVTTCTYTTRGAYDPATGSTSAGTGYSCSAVITTYNAVETDGTLIKATDRKAIVRAASLTVTPTTEGTLTVGTNTYAVVNVSSDPATATYELQLRA